MTSGKLCGVPPSVKPDTIQGAPDRLDKATLRSTMPEMHRWFIAVAALALLSIQTSFGTGDKPVRPVLASQVSELRAVVVSGRDGSPWLRVSAKAWAPHPGYTRPRLARVKSSSGNRLLRLRFLLDPPAGEGFWPMVLVEVEATALLPLGRHRRVQVRGRDGSVAVRIDPSGPVFPPHWGPPPSFQTKDLGTLPAKYGFGSSTLGRWIARNLRAE